jgi:hypothetical protein
MGSAVQTRIRAIFCRVISCVSACQSNPSVASAIVNPNSSKKAGFSLCKNASLAIRHDISGIAGIPEKVPHSGRLEDIRIGEKGSEMSPDWDPGSSTPYRRYVIITVLLLLWQLSAEGPVTPLTTLRYLCSQSAPVPTCPKNGACTSTSEWGGGPPFCESMTSPTCPIFPDNRHTVSYYSTTAIVPEGVTRLTVCIKRVMGIVSPWLRCELPFFHPPPHPEIPALQSRWNQTAKWI